MTGFIQDWLIPLKIILEQVNSDRRRPLYGLGQSIDVTNLVFSKLPAKEIIERVGSAVADLVLAVAPHKDQVWLACGSGLKGAYGLEAAKQLKQAGKSPIVTSIYEGSSSTADNQRAYQQALSAGVEFHHGPMKNSQVCIDALSDTGHAEIQLSPDTDRCVSLINAGDWEVISVDLPTGLNPDTGQTRIDCVHADHTLNLLTLKPGLFLARGRDVVGKVWITNLGAGAIWEHCFQSPKAWMMNPSPRPSRAHNSHKGTFGQVAIIGGAKGMVGAAVLAGTAALHAGAGRVVVFLVGQGVMTFDQNQPALMFNALEALELQGSVAVCGCGGGKEMADILPSLLKQTAPQVLDADALNAIADHESLALLLKQRADRGLFTILTPHPLEAARLLHTSVEKIQGDRLQACANLSNLYQCIAVLKGAGTIVASPNETPYICPTGNARLATAGTGDVLAGMIGANIAQGMPPFHASLAAVFMHGRAADIWRTSSVLTADQLAKSPHIAPSAPWF